MRRKRRKAFMVIGMGRFGSSLAVALTNLGHEVLGIDIDMNVVEELRDSVHEMIQLDATNPRALREMGVPDYDACVVGRGEDLGDSISITMNLRDLGATQIIAKAVTERHARVLEKIGADQVIFPERDIGERLAHMLVSPRISDFFELAPNASVLEIEPPSSTHQKTLAELALRPTWGITVLGIRRGEDFLVSPGAASRIQPGDQMVVLGEESAIEDFMTS